MNKKRKIKHSKRSRKDEIKQLKKICGKLYKLYDCVVPSDKKYIYKCADCHSFYDNEDKKQIYVCCVKICKYCVNQSKHSFYEIINRKTGKRFDECCEICVKSYNKNKDVFSVVPLNNK